MLIIIKLNIKTLPDFREPGFDLGNFIHYDKQQITVSTRNVYYFKVLATIHMYGYDNDKDFFIGQIGRCVQFFLVLVFQL